MEIPRKHVGTIDALHSRVYGISYLISRISYLATGERMNIGAGLTSIATEQASITDLVFDSLRDAITTGQIAPGERLSELALAKALSVSKTPVRESLLRLRHIGLVEPDSRGLAVVMPSESRIRDAYKFRGCLEGFAASTAAELADSAQIDRITELAAASAAPDAVPSGHVREQKDRDFHDAVASAAGNGLLKEAIHNAYLLSWTLRLRDLPSSRETNCSEDHVQVAAAIANRDSEAAGRTMSNHLNRIMDMILERADLSRPGADSPSHAATR